MQVIYYPDKEATDKALKVGEPLLMLISFDGSRILAGPIDDNVEHHILLSHVGEDSRRIDEYFRIVLDDSGADWTFVCPPDYKGIEDKGRRISAFYKDGFNIIARVLEAFGLLVGINIPRRYQRHIEVMRERA